MPRESNVARALARLLLRPFQRANAAAVSNQHTCDLPASGQADSWSLSELAQAADMSGCLLLRTDTDGRILRANATAETVLAPLGKLQGRYLQDLSDDDRERWALKQWTQNFRVSRGQAVMARLGVGSVRKSLRLRIGPVLDDRGRLQGFLCHGEQLEVPADTLSSKGFLAVAAHQLRTPLTGLRLQADLLSTATDAPTRREFSAQLICSVDSMTRLINQLTVLARADSLHPDASPRFPVQLNDAFTQSMTTLQHEAARKSIKLQAQLGWSCLLWDSFSVLSVLHNVLHNAITYTPPGGCVQVSAQEDSRGTILLVDDSGPGIAEADRDAAFERFRRLGQEDGKGAGLGLSIVQSLVSFHGATIALQNSPLGGLRVRIDVPTPEEGDLKSTPGWSSNECRQLHGVGNLQCGSAGSGLRASSGVPYSHINGIQSEGASYT